MVDQRSYQRGITVQIELNLDLCDALEQTFVAHARLSSGDDLFNRSDQPLGKSIFGNIAGGALVERFERDRFASFSGREDHRHVGVTSLHRINEFQPVHLRHLQVGNNDVAANAAHDLKGANAVLSVFDQPIKASLASQQPFDNTPIDGGIIDNQHNRHRYSPSFVSHVATNQCLFQPTLKDTKSGSHTR